MDLVFNTKDEAKYVYVGVQGEIDLYSVKLLKEKVSIIIESKRVCNLMLDLTEINYIDSTGLGILIGIRRRCTEKGGKMVIVSGSERITNLFGITGLNKVFVIYKTIVDAAAAFD